MKPVEILNYNKKKVDGNFFDDILEDIKWCSVRCME